MTTVGLRGQNDEMKVLIGVPTLNGPDRLDRCLASIQKYTDLTDVAVLVSDDFSDEENLKLNKDVVHTHGVEMLMTDQRLGISKQWNRLVRHVPDAEIVALLNDDVEVVEDWLDVLVFSLSRNPLIGSIGLRSEYGMTAAQAEIEGWRRPRRDHHVSHINDGCGALLWPPGPCFAFRREDWSNVGEFDERYPLYHVDCDFGLKLRVAGKRNCFTEYPVIYHMGGATMTHLDPQPKLREGQGIFLQKWGKSFSQLREEFLEAPVQYVEWNSTWRTHP